MTIIQSIMGFMGGMGNKALNDINNVLGVVLGSLFFVFIFSMSSSAGAFDAATLSEIRISSKDNYSYKIILKTDKDVPVEKFTTADDKIVIELKNTKSANSVNTVYNNTPEIDNVIVQSASKDRVRVFIEGLNISSSKVILDSRNATLDLTEDENFPVIPSVGQKKPISEERQKQQEQSTSAADNIEKAPGQKIISLADEGVPQDELLMDEPKAKNSLGSLGSFSIAGISLKQIFGKEGFSWMLRIFAVIFIAVGAYSVFLNFSKQKGGMVNAEIGGYKEREMELYRLANNRKELASKSLGSNYTKETFVDKSTKGEGKTGYGANRQYGIKEYRNSQMPQQKLGNPPLNHNGNFSSNHRINEQTELKINLKRNANELNSAKRMQQALPQVQQPRQTVQKTRQNVNQKEVNSAKANYDNVKFLESMAAIYQKSGRDDLAKNIRKSLVQNRING